MRYVGILLAGILLLAGLVAILSVLGMRAFGEAGENLAIYPAVWLQSTGLGPALTDSSHGPPFLNLLGIGVVYLLPAGLFLWPTFGGRSRANSPRPPEGRSHL